MPGGRPTKYKSEYVEQAEYLSRFGLTDQDFAKFFKVNIDTIHEWKKKHPEFSDALTMGKKIADEKVERSLYERALGYTHPEEKIFCKDGEVTKVNTTKHYPPDPASMIFWLKNRQPKRWRDRQDIEMSGKNGGPLDITVNIVKKKS